MRYPDNVLKADELYDTSFLLSKIGDVEYYEIGDNPTHPNEVNYPEYADHVEENKCDNEHTID